MVEVQNWTKVAIHHFKLCVCVGGGGGYSGGDQFLNPHVSYYSFYGKTFTKLVMLRCSFLLWETFATFKLKIKHPSCLMMAP